MSRIELPPRLVDWGLLAVVTLALATGLVSLVSGRPTDWPVFVLHALLGLSVLPLLYWKLRRVRPRLTGTTVRRRRVALSVALTLAALAAVGTGVLWVFGVEFGVWRWTGMVVHGLLGVLAAVLVVVHLSYRFRAPDAAAFRSRRAALGYLAVAGFGTAAYLAQREANRLLRTPGAARRFTGSRERGTDAGNAFPTTSWVADDPDPVDRGAWRLRVDGAVAEPFELGYADLVTDAGARVLLDCTSGWYTVQDWRGVRVGDLLDRARPDDDARWVRFVSVTGYRWSLPVEEARDALLATHVGNGESDGSVSGDPDAAPRRYERLSHGHGSPMRLVAPGRRGFQWVKWVEAVEVRTDPDYGQWVAIFTSSFD